MLWVNRNFNKNKKNDLNKNYLNRKKTNFNSNKLSKQGSLLNLNSNYLYNNIIKNKYFPNVNSIDMNNSPIKKIFELNDINSNKKELKHNRSNFFTINSSKNLIQVHSARNIHKKNSNSKIKKMLNQNTFSHFSQKRNKVMIKTKASRKIKSGFKKSNYNLYLGGYNKYNFNN